MKQLEILIQEYVSKAMKSLFDLEVKPEEVGLQETSKGFDGDITVVVFPWVKVLRKAPTVIGESLGKYLVENVREIQGFQAVAGFVNLSVSPSFYLEQWWSVRDTPDFGLNYLSAEEAKKKTPIVIEYSSPNTNKPLHLGHMRNILLGWSIAEILKANGNAVQKVNLVNDRGIHICKSMLAWLKFGNGETPVSSGMKGDHLVGKYYVSFSQHYKEEVDAMVASGVSREEAEKNAPIQLEAQEMLRKWEAGDPEVRTLWEKMNTWVYEGFDATYSKMGVDFDKIYYESQTYLLGKDIVLKGLEDGVLFKKEDGSVWADLTGEGLDQKLLLRKDGTSVYMTQDLGTAYTRHQDYQAERLIYVVGNEQNYHFDVLKRVLKKLGYSWSDSLVHLSYGMVELPEGKMKSREGTVVDADDLMEEMKQTARRTTEELGKVNFSSEEETDRFYHQVAMGALKYFILKVDPVKNMLFNPKESIDFNGNTGPFIQYTRARICSLLEKGEACLQNAPAGSGFLSAVAPMFSVKEKTLLRKALEFPQAVDAAAQSYSPAVIANYAYDLAKEFNGFYQEISILKEENEDLRALRLLLSRFVGQILVNALHLLGIEAPQKM